MKPIECPVCGGDRLHHCRLHGGLLYSWWRVVPITGATCLDCGVVTTYLDDWRLGRLRVKKGLGEQAKGEPIDDF